MDSDRPESGDTLEAELSGLRPAALTPHLVSRIAAELAAEDAPRIQAGTSRPHVRWMIGALAAGLAASFVVTAVMRHGQTVPLHPNIVVGPPAPPAQLAAAPDRPVTLAAYRSALARSPEDALALLDRQTKWSSPDASPRAFGRLAAAGAHGETDVP
jgi:hypothetical protein